MRNNMFPTSSIQFEERANPFENLGTDTQGLLTAKECMEQAGLDWRVELRPTFTQLANGKYVEVKHNKIPVRTDENIPFNAVGNRYVPFQNVQCFDFLDLMIDDFGATYDTAGAFDNGAIVYMMLKLPQEIKIGDDEVVPYLTMVNSHNGSTSLKAFTTPIRITCSNTLRLAIQQSKSSFAFKHTANATGKIAQGREALQISFEYYDEFQKELEKFIETPATVDTLNNVLDNVLVLPTERTDIDHNILNEGAITKVKLSRSKIIDIFENGDSNSVKDNAWGIVNAINDWELWTAEIRGDKSRFERQAKSVLNGRLHPITDKAFNYMKQELVKV